MRAWWAGFKVWFVLTNGGGTELPPYGDAMIQRAKDAAK